MKANNKQINGEHYRSNYQHWDFAEIVQLSYLDGCATKYLTRWKDKGGIDDLRKARHYLEKAMELKQATREMNDAQIDQFIFENHKSFTTSYERDALESIVHGEYDDAWHALDTLINLQVECDLGEEPGRNYVDQG